MANVNRFELEACLEGLLTFVAAHPDKDYVRDHGRAVAESFQELHGALVETDLKYHEWRSGDAASQIALKKLHRAYKAAQGALTAVGATGWPEYPVDYLESEVMQEAAERMLSYLQAHPDLIDDASDLIATLRTQLERSRKGTSEGTQARDEYQRLVSRRIRAMDQAVATIRRMRLSIRADLGMRHPAYKAVAWPATVSPD